MTFLTNHIRDTDAPQTYVNHGRFALKHSFMMIAAGLVGIIHAVFPWWFPFWTAEQIIITYQALSCSGRHNDQIDRIFQADG